MAKQHKKPGTGRGGKATQSSERSKEPTCRSPRASLPPGRVLTGRHGPQSVVPVISGADRLRKTLNLSPTCPLQQVYDDAVAEIEQLRTVASKREEQWWKRE